MSLLVILFLYLDGIQAAPLDFARQNTTFSRSLESEPVCKDTRSLWDIIWSCLVTSFACSWVSVHPNMPKPREGRVKKGLRRLELMFWSIMSPELIIMWAIRQWLGALSLEDKYRDRGWTKTHGYFLQMGGFRLYDGDISKGVLSAEKFENLLQSGRINMPTITEKDLQDHSKGDGLSKALVIVQTSWFITQSIARAASGLVLTQIELMTLAFAALNSIMFFFWWNKPLDVQSTVAVYLLEPSHSQTPNGGGNNEIPVQVVEPILPSAGIVPAQPRHPKPIPRKFWQILSGIIYRWPVAGLIITLRRMDDMVQLGPDPVVDGLDRVPAFYALPIPVSSHYDMVNIKVIALVSIIGALFGSIHCAGWFFILPTEAEVTLWRTFSIIVAGVPMTGIWCIVMYFIDIYRITPRVGDTFHGVFELLVFFVPFYLIARVGLLVGAVIALRDLPAGAYDVITWTTFLPHV